MKIHIYNGKGALVREQEARLGAGNNKYSVNMKGLVSGIYQVVLQWNNGNKFKTIKIVKE